MFRHLGGISLMLHSIDKAWDTYKDVLGLKAGQNTQVFEAGRYNQHTFRIGDTALWLLEPMDPPEAPGPGGGMARFLRRHGEGLYMITVGLGDEADLYAKRLEAKGVKVYWDIPDSGVETGGGPKDRTFQMTIHPLIHPRSVHGVLWEMSRYVPGNVRRQPPANNPWKRVMSINIVVKDADAAAKTYTEVLELDPVLSRTVYPKVGYRECTIGMGDVALEFQQPLVAPDSPTRGGQLAKTLQQFGEGLHSVTIDVKEPEDYARSLEAKGVKIDRLTVANGQRETGRPKPAVAGGTLLYVIDPASAHGVPWEFRHFTASVQTM